MMENERDLRLVAGQHQSHVSVVRWPNEAPILKVGAFGPEDAVSPSALLFMVEMDAPTARTFACKLLAALQSGNAGDGESTIGGWW
jgi:hypothetical protein